MYAPPLDLRPDAPSGLFLSKQGHWYFDRERVRHQRMSALLSRSIARDGDGKLIVTTGRDVLAFVAEDAPLRVVALKETPTALLLALSDESEATLESDLLFDAFGQLRGVVKTSQFWALFSRGVAQALLDRAVETPNGAFEIPFPFGPLSLRETAQAMDYAEIPNFPLAH